MKISDLCGLLNDIRGKHGDIEVYCGDCRIAGLSILPAELIDRTWSENKNLKVVAIIARTDASLVLPRR